MVTPYIAFKAG